MARTFSGTATGWHGSAPAGLDTGGRTSSLGAPRPWRQESRWVRSHSVTRVQRTCLSAARGTGSRAVAALRGPGREPWGRWWLEPRCHPARCCPPSPTRPEAAQASLAAGLQDPADQATGLVPAGPGGLWWAPAAFLLGCSASPSRLLWLAVVFHSDSGQVATCVGE